MERANGQVSGSDTSWLLLPITSRSVNRLPQSPVVHTHKGMLRWQQDSEEITQPSMFTPPSDSLGPILTSAHLLYSLIPIPSFCAGAYF